MSLVERAAALLGSTAQPQEKPAKAVGESASVADSGVMERALLDRSEHLDFAAGPQIARQPPSKNRTAIDGGASRTVQIDMDQLRARQVVTPDAERNPISENFRRIKRHILAKLASSKAVGGNLVMLTSPLPGEGKTFCTVNLAISLAMEMDRTVLLVDADVAKPSVTDTLGIKAEAEKGLMDILVDSKLDLTDVLCRTNIGKLTVLPAGTPHPRATEMLASDRMRVLLREMAERYPDRIIIFDSPPLLAASEASVLATEMGQIILVVEAGKTTESALKDALGRIESNNVVGVLLNKGVPPGGFGDYGYGYGYGYGA